MKSPDLSDPQKPARLGRLRKLAFILSGVSILQFILLCPLTYEVAQKGNDSLLSLWSVSWYSWPVVGLAGIIVFIIGILKKEISIGFLIPVLFLAEVLGFFWLALPWGFYH